MRHRPKMVTHDILYHFHTFAALPHDPKITRLNIINISARKYSLSEVNFSSIWINNLGYILMDSMADSPVLFTVLAIIITSNPSLHILVPFILVTSQ